MRLRRSTLAAQAAGRHILQRRIADAGLGQNEAHIIGGRFIAGEMGGDRAHLLIARQQQEGGCAAIALDAGDEELRLGMLKLAPAMRRHRSAGMEIGIDQGTERAAAFDDWIEIELDFAREGEIRALAGRRDDAIERTNGALTLRRQAVDQDAIAVHSQALGGEG
ncbi:MAG: hypothetical protein ACREUF_07700, partial [Solimonas sp.]